ncbi:hypothetical protein [Deinococcus peraridilitoris]|uniref:Uncharacterized protein n=1 Tax=Deinococcus peraridilitoris (strain DSM 19664 / LMG 22246 / CIP 109416 / KR-200) TaxID=937777 RepID=L0A032_DEIPD|nr:hypothetical protein [Deinococcus peraridilitoris]AFZ67191.1 hypothetical protein Deipe_1658 [Deinococcus peraridilitoris DSM 19664]
MGYTKDRWRARKARRYQREHPGPSFVWSRLYLGATPSLASVKRTLLYKSLNVLARHGGRRYKRRYQQLWRQQAREQEYAALIGDEVRFERINPDAERGAIAWDWW